MKYVFIITIISILVFSLLSFAKYKSKEKVGNVSWYGSTHHGKITASGQVFNMYNLTAAHKTLPFGTKVRITNPLNRISVIVTINDRGPYIKDREFDLSKKAFSRISPLNKGLLKIRYKILK